MVFLEVEMQFGVKGLLPYKVVILHLMEDFIIKKSSNEHGFFVAVTSLNKIGEGRIRDLTGDAPFFVTSKCIMLVAIASLNKIGGGRIRDHIGASCQHYPGGKPIVIQGGLELRKSVFVLIIQILLSLFDAISE